MIYELKDELSQEDKLKLHKIAVEKGISIEELMARIVESYLSKSKDAKLGPQK